MKVLRLAPLALLALASWSPVARAERAQLAQLTQQAPQPPCVKFWGQTRARVVGYDHVVVIDNTCARPAACVVSTDVAPEPLRVTVAARESTALTTFRGSPASVFTPRVACQLQ